MSDIKVRLNKYRDYKSESAKSFISGDANGTNKIIDIGQMLNKIGADSMTPMIIEAYEGFEKIYNSSMCQWSAFVANSRMKAIDERLKNE